MSKTVFKCACITGASMGLGHAFAWECAARGMDLLLISLPGEKLPETAEEIRKKYGVAVEWLEVDLTDPDAPLEILSLIRSKKLEPDILINNAGISSVGFFMDAGLDYHQSVIDVNVNALVRLSYMLIPELMKRERSGILNVASLSAIFPIPYLPVYSATKSFILSFSAALRLELKGQVGVSVLCPNTIRAPGQVQDFIDQLGLHCRIACLTPERIARVALDGLSRNRSIIVPGWINRLIHAIAPIAPGSLVAFVARRYWGEFGKLGKQDAKDAAGAETSDENRRELRTIG